MLITMLAVWAHDGKPHYSSMSQYQSIAYVGRISRLASQSLTSAR